MTALERNLNALLVVGISCVLLGSFGIQFFKGEQPCILCLLQRAAMIGVATGALLNLRMGVRPMHYSLSLFFAAFGGSVALRQFLLHVCANFPTFGVPLWGLSLYTWSFLIFAASVVYIGVLLLLYKPSEKTERPPALCGLGAVAFGLLFLVAFANIFVSFALCGLGVCEA